MNWESANPVCVCVGKNNNSTEKSFFYFLHFLGKKVGTH